MLLKNKIKICRDETKNRQSEIKKEKIEAKKNRDIVNNSINKLERTKMPKMKTKSAAKKRFAVTGSGRIKRKHAYHSHILTKKSIKRKRILASTCVLSNADERTIREMI